RGSRSRRGGTKALRRRAPRLEQPESATRAPFVSRGSSADARDSSSWCGPPVVLAKVAARPLRKRASLRLERPTGRIRTQHSEKTPRRERKAVEVGVSRDVRQAFCKRSSPSNRL